MSAQRGGRECNAPSHWTASPFDERSARRTFDAGSDESRTRQFCLRKLPSDSPSVSCWIKCPSRTETRTGKPTRSRPHKTNARTRAHKGSNTNTSTAEAREGPPKHQHRHNTDTTTHAHQGTRNARRRCPRKCSPCSRRQEGGSTCQERQM